MGKLRSIQILRLVAALLVVFVHAAQWRYGFIGVDIFFVISGFVIARVMPGKSFPVFVRDRFVRIFPIFWLCLAVRSIEKIPELGWSAERFASSVTLWPVIGGFNFPYLFVGWTLCFEVLFYGGAAVTILAGRPIALWLYPLALAGAFLTDFPLLKYVGNPLVIEFLIGVGLSYMKPTRSRKLAAIAILIAIALIGIVPIVGRPENIIDLSEWYRPLVWGVPAAMIVWGALQFEAVLKGSIAEALAYGGDASYSLYLTHTILLWHLLPFMPWPLAAWCVVCLGITVHRYVEAPILRRLRVTSNKSRSNAPADSPLPNLAKDTGS